MFKKLKMKITARRVERKKSRSKNTVKSRRNTTRTTFWGWVGAIVVYPFKKLAAWCKSGWNLVRAIDLVGLVNLTLLMVIIVLFSMLIIDVINCRHRATVVAAQPVPAVEMNAPEFRSDTRTVKTRPLPPTLPLARDAQTNKFIAEPVHVVRERRPGIGHSQIVRKNNDVYGDIVIDNRDMIGVLERGARVHGNLYLQNMRKYTLPCDVHIDGNLFLRDLNMLQFCGDFTITGNIYVSPRSSFGPIPRTARLGGQVIL